MIRLDSIDTEIVEKYNKVTEAQDAIHCEQDVEPLQESLQIMKSAQAGLEETNL